MQNTSSPEQAAPRSLRYCGHLVPLSQEVRIAVDTATAAYHLNRRPQTLRSWASTETGPIKPHRVLGRLAWPVDEIRRIMIGAEAHAQSRSQGAPTFLDARAAHESLCS